MFCNVPDSTGNFPYVVAVKFQTSKKDFLKLRGLRYDTNGDIFNGSAEMMWDIKNALKERETQMVGHYLWDSIKGCPNLYRL